MGGRKTELGKGRGHDPLWAVVEQRWSLWTYKGEVLISREE